MTQTPTSPQAVVSPDMYPPLYRAALAIGSGPASMDTTRYLDTHGSAHPVSGYGMHGSAPSALPHAGASATASGYARTSEGGYGGATYHSTDTSARPTTPAPAHLISRSSEPAAQSGQPRDRPSLYDQVASDAAQHAPASRTESRRGGHVHHGSHASPPAAAESSWGTTEPSASVHPTPSSAGSSWESAESASHWGSGPEHHTAEAAGSATTPSGTSWSGAVERSAVAAWDSMNAYAAEPQVPDYAIIEDDSTYAQHRPPSSSSPSTADGAASGVYSTWSSSQPQRATETSSSRSGSRHPMTSSTPIIDAPAAPSAPAQPETRRGAAGQRAQEQHSSPASYGTAGYHGASASSTTYGYDAPPSSPATESALDAAASIYVGDGSTSSSSATGSEFERSAQWESTSADTSWGSPSAPTTPSEPAAQEWSSFAASSFAPSPPSTAHSPAEASYGSAPAAEPIPVPASPVGSQSEEPSWLSSSPPTPPHPTPALPEPTATCTRGIPIIGGKMGDGVLRYGDCVRHTWSDTANSTVEVLRGLSSVGFQAAPKVVEVREGEWFSVTYLDGHVPERPQWFSTVQVKQAGQLLRAYHEASVQAFPSTGDSIVCHGDPTPMNCVFRSGRPIALIDFAEVRVTSRMREVAYAAWMWCVSSREYWPGIDDQAFNVAYLLDGYGLPHTSRATFASLMVQAQDDTMEQWREKARSATASSDQCADMIRWTQRERQYLTDHLGVFQAVLDMHHPGSER